MYKSQFLNPTILAKFYRETERKDLLFYPRIKSTSPHETDRKKVKTQVTKAILDIHHLTAFPPPSILDSLILGYHFGIFLPESKHRPLSLRVLSSSIVLFLRIHECHSHPFFIITGHKNTKKYPRKSTISKSISLVFINGMADTEILMIIKDDYLQ